MFSLLQPVRRMASYLPDQLASQKAIHQIGKIADWFPAAITNCFCFEVRLGKASSTADFAFLCNRDSTGADILADGSSIKLHDELFMNSVWNHLRDFSHRWTGPESGLRDAVTHLWIELDSDQYNRVPVPSVFLGMPRDHPSDVAWLLPLLETLNYSISKPLLETLQHCFRSSVLANKRISLGLMFSRETDRARLVFHDINDDVLRLLPELGFANLEDLKWLVTDLLKMAAHLNLSIDAGASIGSKVGLECQFGDHVRKDHASWTRLLNYLVGLGCCSPEKSEALLLWPGGTRERLQHLLWPAAVVRKIKHLKIVYEAGSPLEAKAYLFSIFR
jgi:hypothetical protein